MIAPDADQVKISICAVSDVRESVMNLAWRVDDDVAAGQRGVEERTHSTVGARFSTRPMTWSNLVTKRLSAVRMPPFGPKLYLRACQIERKRISERGRRRRAQVLRFDLTHCFMTSL